MKPIPTALTILGLAASCSLPARAAAQQTITVDQDTMASGLIGIAALKLRTMNADIAAFGIVVDRSPAIRARAAVLRAAAAERLAAATLARTRKLYRSAQNVSEADLESAEAREAEAQASLDAARATPRARFGSALAQAIIDGGPVWHRIESGGALISVVHRGPPLGAVPTTAQGRTPDGPTLALRAVGRAGRLPQGVVGQAYYFTGPPLAIGTTLQVAIADDHKDTGYAVPVSALIYRGDMAYAFAETGPRRFTETVIPQTRPIRSKGAIIAYFVPASVLPKAGADTGRIVSNGAGLVRSVAAGAHGPAPGADHD